MQSLRASPRRGSVRALAAIGPTRRSAFGRRFDSRRLHSAPRRLRRGIVRQAEGWVRPGGSATWARVDHDLRRAKHMVAGDPPLTVVTEHGNNFLDRSLLRGGGLPGTFEVPSVQE